MYTYKNKSDRELSIVGVGVVGPGETIQSKEKLNNANLELEGEPKREKVEAPKGDKETKK